MAACGLLGFAATTAKATADEAATAESTGKPGHQLQWLPYRPTVMKVDPNVRPTAHEADALPEETHRQPTRAHRDRPGGLTGVSEVPHVAERPTPARRPDSPFHDPFGDREADTDSEPTQRGHDLLAQQRDLLDPPRSQPGLDRSLPPLDAAPTLQRGAIPIDDPTTPRGLTPLPVEPLTPVEPVVPQVPDLPRAPAIEPQPPVIEDVPAERAPAVEERLEAPPETRPSPEPDEAEDIVRREADLTLKCISPEDFRPVTEITTDITPHGDLPNECPLTDDVFDLEQARVWAPITFTWKAAALCHKPLYFEQVQLERYGHSWGPYVQPFISGAHFFLTVPILPYKMGLKAPTECVYTLGYYRPGNCAPYMLDPIPLSVRAGLTQAGVMTGAACIFP